MNRILKNVTSNIISITDTIQLVLASNQEYVVKLDELDSFLVSNKLEESIKNEDIQVGNGTEYYTNGFDGWVFFATTFDGVALLSDSTSIETFTPIIVTDSISGKKASSLFMNMLTMMKEFYNNPSSPIYEEGFQPLIGPTGREVEHIGRTANLENIHNKGGWHEQQVQKSLYIKPLNLLIYYGWLNSFNSVTNAWTNELVAQDFSKYDMLVFGDGLQDPSHGDYSNTVTIINRLKELKPNAIIFGYVSVNQTYSNFTTKVDQWNTLTVHGIFMDEAGYDYGSVSTNGRVAFNEKVNYVHGKSSSNICFANCWNMDHIIGTENDVSYPNTTWNPSLISSNLSINDWYLLESFAVNTDAYSANNGYESKTDWYSRGTKAISRRETFNINIASVSIIQNNNKAVDQFKFFFISACMWSLNACGSSDIYYGSSSAAVVFRPRPDIISLGNLWSLTPTIKVSSSDSDVYLRYIEFGNLLLDFSTAAQLSSITIDSLKTCPFFVIDNVGNQSIISTEIILLLNSIVTNNSNYSLSSNEITVLSNGTYKIDYCIVYDVTNTSGGATGSVTAWIEKNSVVINGSQSRAYHNEVSGGSGVIGFATISLSANDVIRVKVIRSNGTTNIDTTQNYSSLSIIKVG